MSDEAKARLQAMNRPVPEADPVAYARMKYEMENRTNRGFMSKVWGPFSGHPDMTPGGQVGQPADDRLPSDHPGQRSRGSGRDPRRRHGVTDVGAQIAADSERR